MANKYSNKACNEITVNINNIARTFRFKSDGNIQDPRTSTAYRGNGVVNGGIYDAFTLTGTVQMSKSMLEFLSDAFNEGQLAISTAAIYKQFLTLDGGVYKYMKFKNCRLASPPSINITADGGGDNYDVTLNLSLNDLMEEGWKAVE